MNFFEFLKIFCSQVAGQMLEMNDLGKTFQSLGWYFMTVLIGIFIHGGVVLPLIYGKTFILEYILKKMSLYIILLCCHLYHLLTVSILSLQYIHYLLQLC